MPVKIYLFPIDYKCSESSYPIKPLPGSVIQEAAIFAFKNKDLQYFDGYASTAVALKLSEDINDSNYYKTIERLKNLICLSYSVPVDEKIFHIEYKSVQDAINANLSEKFNNDGIIYGLESDKDKPLRVAAYSYKVSKLSEKNANKFWQSLQTFTYARLLNYLPNPQYKYTLYMSLYLASINQLADKRKNVHESPNKLICNGCETDINMTHQTSHVEEIINLIQRIIPLEYQEDKIKMIKQLFHPIRSNYIHEGRFAGSEDIGGVIGLWGSPTMTKLGENDVNLMYLNKALLEQFLEQNVTSA